METTVLSSNLLKYQGLARQDSGVVLAKRTWQGFLADFLTLLTAPVV